MQITLNQAEIQVAVSEYLTKRVAFGPGDTLNVNFKATRGSEDCVQVTIDVLPEGSEVPFQVAEPEPEVTKPATRKVQERKHVRVPEKKVEPEPEAAEEPAAEPETPKEEATQEAEAAEPEPASQEAEVAEKAQEAEVAEAPKKSLFAGLKR